eukprot:7391875-Prymnesium_polylepis.6
MLGRVEATNLLSAGVGGPSRIRTWGVRSAVEADPAVSPGRRSPRSISCSAANCSSSSLARSVGGRSSGIGNGTLFALSDEVPPVCTFGVDLPFDGVRLGRAWLSARGSMREAHAWCGGRLSR